VNLGREIGIKKLFVRYVILDYEIFIFIKNIISRPEDFCPLANGATLIGIY